MSTTPSFGPAVTTKNTQSVTSVLVVATDENGIRTELTIRTTHHKHGHYTTSATRCRSNNYSSIMILMTDLRPIPALTVDTDSTRFSLKQLEALHEHARANVTDHLAEWTSWALDCTASFTN